MIPKIIHYCWFGPKEITPVGKKCIASWKKFLPDYEIKFWNEENSPINVPFVKDALAAKKYAFVADYVRIWALKNFGGIYMDTDMLVLKNFDELLDSESFVGYETENKINAAIIGSNINSVFIDKLFEYYNNLKFEEAKINEISIPINISKIYNELAEIYRPRVYSVDYFYSLPFDSTINGVFNYKKYITKNSLAVHLWNASWLDELNDYRKENQKLSHKVKTWLLILKNKFKL
ncbi:MAG: glycosyl transferase [Bacteroidales bacterium]|nr:glycosyl transferase [Bacteroidales bacterium]